MRSQVTNILRDEILSGRLKAGAILNEKDLAERLGVSKTPVREALTLLDHEGLIQTLPRKGYFVSPITIQDVHNLFELRIILEGAAVEMAVAKITDEQIDQLSGLATNWNSTDDTAKQLDQNVQFHHFIARLSGNEHLASLIRKLLLDMQRMIAQGFVSEGHEELVLAFRERDPHRVAEAMRDHIRGTRDKVLRVVATPRAP